MLIIARHWPKFLLLIVFSMPLGLSVFERPSCKSKAWWPHTKQKKTTIQSYSVTYTMSCPGKWLIVCGQRPKSKIYWLLPAVRSVNWLIKQKLIFPWKDMICCIASSYAHSFNYALHRQKTIILMIPAVIIECSHPAIGPQRRQCHEPHLHSP